MSDNRLPDPALVALVGPSAAGKSTWAQARYRRQEIVSSDELRAVVGSGPRDLDASQDAFDVLERVVEARLGRGLTTVVDTLGTDADRRRRWLERARAAGVPAVVVVLDTPEGVCRRRNAEREVPVPAAVLAAQVARHRDTVAALTDEGWDLVRVVPGEAEGQPPQPRSVPEDEPAPGSPGLQVMLQVSRFPWGEDPAGWLRGVAQAAAANGFAGIALMDHLVQVPQVDRAWSPIPEPWVTLGLLAGLDTRLRLGTLCTPVTFRPPGVVAKAVATLDVLSGGRAFVGLGAGWWEREHQAFGLPFPGPRERLDAVEDAIGVMRALWSPGTKAYAGPRVALPETTAYPRPAHDVPIILGGSGARTLRIGARLADAVNVRVDHVDRALRAVEGTDVDVTVLDLPTVGRDRDDTWRRVERLRGRTPAAAYARRTHAGIAAEHRDRYASLAERGVTTVFVAVADLEGPDDVERLAGLT